jgi:hypothetical protein
VTQSAGGAQTTPDAEGEKRVVGTYGEGDAVALLEGELETVGVGEGEAPGDSVGDAVGVAEGEGVADGAGEAKATHNRLTEPAGPLLADAPCSPPIEPARAYEKEVAVEETQEEPPPPGEPTYVMLLSVFPPPPP